MIKNPFLKKPSFKQKLSSAVKKIPHPESGQEKRKKKLLQILVYVAVFLAGFVLSKVHTLLMIAG